MAAPRNAKRVVDLTPERWAQVEELFHRAAECGPEQRNLLLDEAGRSDPDLRREVEALLSCDGSAGDYVRAAVRTELDTVGFPLAGETISHYRILDGRAAVAWAWCIGRRTLSCQIKTDLIKEGSIQPQLE